MLIDNIVITFLGNIKGVSDVTNLLGTEVIVVREKRLVNAYLVKSGMLRFSFLLDCCQPGSVPDANMLAALLDLVSKTDEKSILIYCGEIKYIMVYPKIIVGKQLLIKI